MNIVFITNYYYPHIGGVEKHVENLSNVLMKDRNNNISIITERYDKSLKKFEVFRNVHIYRISYPHIKFLGLFFLWIEIAKKIPLLIKANVIHIHDVFIWYFPLRFILFFKKVYITFHGYEDYPIKIKHVAIRKISEHLCNGNICIGKFMKKWYKTKPDFISYGAVELKKTKIFKNNPIFDAVFIGRLDEQTGIKEYVNAANDLKKMCDFKLLVVGNGKYFEEIKYEAKTIGFKRNATKYLKVAKFAFVSRYLSIIEAFMEKKLIFAIYDNPIKRDYLEMTPFKKWIIIVRNSEELVEKYLNIIKHPHLIKLKTEKGYKWASLQTWDNLSITYNKLWKKN